MLGNAEILEMQVSSAEICNILSDDAKLKISPRKRKLKIKGSKIVIKQKSNIAWKWRSKKSFNLLKQINIYLTVNFGSDLWKEHYFKSFLAQLTLTLHRQFY